MNSGGGVVEGEECEWRQWEWRRGEGKEGLLSHGRAERRANGLKKQARSGDEEDGVPCKRAGVS